MSLHSRPTRVCTFPSLVKRSSTAQIMWMQKKQRARDSVSVPPTDRSQPPIPTCRLQTL